MTTGCGSSRHTHFIFFRASQPKLCVPTEYTLCFASLFMCLSPNGALLCCHRGTSTGEFPDASQIQAVQGVGFGSEVLQILQKHVSFRITIQYSRVQSRFSAYMIREGLPKAEVSESTVLPFHLLSFKSRPTKRVEGYFSPFDVFRVLGSPYSVVATYGLSFTVQ